VPYAPRMSPQRRTALVSVFAALLLIGLKLVAGIHSGSLGLLSEAAHSGTDLAKDMGEEFTATSCELAEDYIGRFG